MNSNDLKEFELFLKGRAEVPPHVERALFSIIHKALNPRLGWTVSKLFLFHVLGSLVTLIFCPQYGVSLVGSLGVLPSYLMQIHPAACFFGCGLLWMIGGQALTYFFFTIDEQRVLSHYRWGAALTIVLLSVLLFTCTGEFRIDEWFLMWILGAAAVTFTFNWPALQRQRRFRMQVGG